MVCLTLHNTAAPRGHGRQQMENKPTHEVLAEISAWQDIQKRNPMTSEAWQFASRALAPLFSEMARRQKAGLL